MKYRLWRSGQTIDLSREKKLGEGGEAGVFCVATMGMAAKIYHRPDPKYAAKLKVMLENPPGDPTSGQGHVSIAWPSDLLFHQGIFHGYVMPLVEGMQPLVNFYVPKLRRQKRPLFDYYYLVTAALNVSTAVRALHDRNYVIGDVNESNILVSDRALATVVDTDSFQVADAASGTIYRCLVGKPEFTPPELQLPGTNFARVDRAREHDCFGLAVMLFQLLMEGTHPFDGVYSGPREPPSIDERIAAGHFPHSDDARGLNRPKPMAPPFGMLEPGLQRLFVQCFVDGHGDPSARPDAATWRGALDKARLLMRTCSANDRHRFWGHVACPWCERARRMGGVDPFPSVQAVKQGQHLQQRSTGAKTPMRAPSPIPARTTPPRGSAVPVRPRASAPPRRPPAGRIQRPPPRASTLPRWIWGGWGIAFVVLQMLISGMNSSRVSPPLPAPPRLLFTPHATPAVASIRFLESPAQGKSYHAQAGISMVWIAPGRFLMGDSSGKGDADETPVHPVRLTTGFWLAESAVTQGQWTEVMGTNPSQAKGDGLPVESVDWNDAAAFCQKLTESERARGRLPAGMEYRLPTEAQWEYACRAGTLGDYAGNLDAMAWYASNSGARTHAVKTKLPNAWGLYDMHGNVWEWCSDWHGSYWAGSQVDPTGPSAGDNRVIRGGAWSRPAAFCRSPSRRWLSPDSRFDNLGFRPAAVPSGGGGATAGAGAALEIMDGARAGEERQMEIANGVSVTMCWVPAGSFTMGSPTSEAGRFANEEQTQVTLSRGFWLAKTECTQKAWRAIMGTSPSHFQGEDLPVEQVSWSDCQTFIDKLRDLGGGWRFDLPTEAQWEYACRAGSAGAYAGDLGAMGWHSDNSGGTTHAVGTKGGKRLGLARHAGKRPGMVPGRLRLPSARRNRPGSQKWRQPRVPWRVVGPRRQGQSLRVPAQLHGGGSILLSGVPPGGGSAERAEVSSERAAETAADAVFAVFTFSSFLMKIGR